MVSLCVNKLHSRFPIIVITILITNNVIWNSQVEGLVKYTKRETMSSMRISVLSAFNLTKELQKVLPNMTIHTVKEPEKDEIFNSSSIIVADYNLIGPYIYNLPNLKWLQGTWAGVEVLLKHMDKSKELPFLLTRYSGHHFGRIMGEYVVSSIINFERDFFRIRENQKSKEWKVDGKIRDYRTIYDLSIGIMGLGNIGNNVGKLLDFMGAKVNGFGRKSKEDLGSEYSYLSGYYTDLGQFLKCCDYIVNVLPSTPQTKGLLNGNILKNCKGAVFINMGRGSIVEEKYLVEALEKKWISGAILDVFEEEPLPESSPLWKFEQVVITPHCAGQSRPKDIAQQFVQNLKLYESGQSIPTAFDPKKGY